MSIISVKNNIIFYEYHIYKENLFSVNEKIESNIIFYEDDIIYNNKYSVKNRSYDFLGKRLFYHNGELYIFENHVLKKGSKYILYDVDDIISEDGLILIYRRGKSYFYDSFFKPVLSMNEKYDLIAFNRNFYLIYFNGTLQLKKYDKTVYWENKVDKIFKIGLFQNYVIYKTKLVYIFNFELMQYEDFKRSYKLKTGKDEFISDFLSNNNIQYERHKVITYYPTDFFVTDNLYFVYYNNIYSLDGPLYESYYKNININNILLSIYNDIHIIQFENKVFFNDYLIKNTAIKYSRIYIGNFLFENFTLKLSYSTYKVDTSRLYIYNEKELEAFFDYEIHYIYIYNDKIYIYTYDNKLVQINKSISLLYKNIYLTNILNDEGNIIFLSFNKRIKKDENIFKDIKNLAFERKKILTATAEETTKLKRKAGEFLKKSEEVKRKYK